MPNRTLVHELALAGYEIPKPVITGDPIKSVILVVSAVQKPEVRRASWIDVEHLEKQSTLPESQPNDEPRAMCFGLMMESDVQILFDIAERAFHHKSLRNLTRKHRNAISP